MAHRIAAINTTSNTISAAATTFSHRGDLYVTQEHRREHQAVERRLASGATMTMSDR